MTLDRLSRRGLAGVASLIAVIAFGQSAVASSILTTSAQANASVYDEITQSWIEQSCTVTGSASAQCNTDLSGGEATASFGSLDAASSASATIYHFQSGADAQATFEDDLTIHPSLVHGSGQGFVQFSLFGTMQKDGYGGADLLFEGESLGGIGPYGPDCVNCSFQTGLYPLTFGTPLDFSVTATSDSLASGDSYILVDLTDILICDANGNSIPDLSLTSGSGTAYPLNARNAMPTPEFGTLTLFGSFL